MQQPRKPPLFFNTTGPCDPERHYMLPPKERLIDTNLERLVDHQLYWVLHAPRQTGKTTFLLSWAKELNATDEVVAAYVSLERCQQIPEIERAMPIIIEACHEYTDFLGLGKPPTVSAHAPSLLSAQLKAWAEALAPKQLVLLFDEVDVLEGPALISFLRQLRGGFSMRGVGRFPTSIALVGLRDLRDYLVQSKDGLPLNPGSPFNIKQQSSSIGCFTRENIARLVAQHEAASGQPCEPAAIDQIFALTAGQPWLVNALLQKCTWQLSDAQPGRPLTAALVDEAKELLIADRAVHLDSLAERLKDPLVQSVIEPIIAGTSVPDLAEGDAFRLCEDLGLVTRAYGAPRIANPIYREILARSLSFSMQLGFPDLECPWRSADGDLDLRALLGAFQDFWRRHGEIWEEKADYTEAFPHLLVMAFFQRIVNGGGQIEREYAAGRGRVDLVIRWQGRCHVVEIKLVHPNDGPEHTRAEGLQQLARYADRLQADSRSLIIFDRRPPARARPWDERIRLEDTPDASGQPTLLAWA